MAHDRARALDRKGAGRSKGLVVALAVVLVGVVASIATAALMVHSTRALGEASSATADRATNVPGQVVVHSAHVVRAGSDVSTLHLFVGSDGRDVDLAGMELRLERFEEFRSFRFGGGNLEVVVQRDPDGSVSAPAPSLGRGDLVELVLHMETEPLLAPGDRALVRWQGSAQDTPPLPVLVPPAGAGTIIPLSIG